MTTNVSTQIQGCELYFRSATALSLGMTPFLSHYIGTGLVNGLLFICDHATKASSLLGRVAKIVLAIPLLLGGIIQYVSAKIFSLTQQLAWGRESVLNPQEDGANTRLARDGAGDKSWNDFKALLSYLC